MDERSSALKHGSPPPGTLAAVALALMIGTAVMNIELNGRDCCTCKRTATCCVIGPVVAVPISWTLAFCVPPPVQVAVSREIEVRHIPQFGIGESDGNFLRRGTQGGAFANGGEDTLKGIGVPQTVCLAEMEPVEQRVEGVHGIQFRAFHAHEAHTRREWRPGIWVEGRLCARHSPSAACSLPCS